MSLALLVINMKMLKVLLKFLMLIFYNDTKDLSSPGQKPKDVKKPITFNVLEPTKEPAFK